MILRRVTALRLHDTAAMRLHETAAILRLEMAAMLRRYDTAARFGCMLQQRYRGSIRRRVAATWYGSDTEARYGGALQRHDTAAIPRTGGGDKRRMRREGQAASVRAATRRRGGGDRRRICMPLHNKRTSGAADRSPCRQTGRTINQYGVETRRNDTAAIPRQRGMKRGQAMDAAGKRGAQYANSDTTPTLLFY